MTEVKHEGYSPGAHPSYYEKCKFCGAFTCQDCEPDGICEPCQKARQPLLAEIERLRAERERLDRNLIALGEAWRGDWSDFDGMQLRAQIDQILEGKNTGFEFYHYSTDDDKKCPWECPFCKESE
jgi:rubrerythrin